MLKIGGKARPARGATMGRVGRLALKYAREILAGLGGARPGRARRSLKWRPAVLPGRNSLAPGSWAPPQLPYSIIERQVLITGGADDQLRRLAQDAITIYVLEIFAVFGGS